MNSFRSHYKTERPPSPLALSSLLGVVVIALALSLAHHLGPQDEGPDASAEWGISQGIEDAHAIEDAEAAFQAQAQKLCSTARGPNSEVRWLPDGSMVCTVRRGVVKAQVQL